MSLQPPKPSFKGRRPSVPEGRRTHITIRLYDKERQAIDAAAEKLGITAGSYIRQTVLNAPVPRQGRRPMAEKRELVRILGLLGNVASNINQIARVLNSGEEADEGLLNEALMAVRDMREGTLRALGREP